MRKPWYREWPFIVGAILYAFNIEWFVIPVIMIEFLQLSGIALVIGSVLWTTGESSYWFWFSGWLIEWIKKKPIIKDGRSFGGEVYDKAKEASIVDKVENWVRPRLIDNFREENYKHKTLFKFLKNVGFLTACGTLFGLGIAPFPLAALTGIVFCRSVKWNIGFMFLLIGTWVKIIGFTQGWSYFLL